MDPIKLTYDVPVSQAAAFYLFVGEFGSWWPPLHSTSPARYESAGIQARVGGAATFTVAGVAEAWGEVLAINPPLEIVIASRMRGEGECPSRIVVTFADSEWGTRVTLVHSGWDKRNETVRGRYASWPLIMSHYVSYARAHARRGAAAGHPVRGVR